MRCKLLLAVLSVFWTATTCAAFDVPDLDLRTLEGRPAGLDEYVGKGKWVLVMFWAVHCPICERNKPDISAFHDKHKARDAVVVGVAIDGMGQIGPIRENIKKHPVSYPNFVGELGVLAVNFQIAAQESFRDTPTYWLFSPEGELLAVNPGPVRRVALETYMARHSM